MVFNSTPFVLFFVVVFFVYWFPLKRTTKAQNVFLLVASYFFYGYADWKMLPLLMVATAVFYFLGIGIGRSESEKKASWLRTLGVALGVGLLLYFKYLNFFIESFANLFERIGLHTNWHSFNIIMPLGVSFFTFRLISYVLDVYNGEVEPTHDVVEFATYIAFFPCILSGPIDKPKFISQIHQKREFNYEQAVDGLRQILWGLFKKLVVADNCAVYVDQVFSSYTDQSGSTLFFAAILCSFQVYADFSGYTVNIGIDLSSGGDLTSWAIEIPLEENAFFIDSHSYMPRGRFEEHIKTDLAPYDVWEKAGLLTVTGGKSSYKNDYSFIIKELRECIEKYHFKINAIGIDPHNADGILSELETFGVPVTIVTQSARSLNDTTTDIQALVSSKRYFYNKKNELLAYSFMNAETVSNSFDEIKIDKPADMANRRIDPTDAVIDAHYCHIKDKKERQTDVNAELEFYLKMIGGDNNV